MIQDHGEILRDLTLKKTGLNEMTCDDKKSPQQGELLRRISLSAGSSVSLSVV